MVCPGLKMKNIAVDAFELRDLYNSLRGFYEAEILRYNVTVLVFHDEAFFVVFKYVYLLRIFYKCICI